MQCLKLGREVAYIYGMPRSQKLSYVAPKMPAPKLVKATPDQVIIDRANAAKARETGMDVTDISDADLLADLRRRRVGA